jgi:hypothetical protein
LGLSGSFPSFRPTANDEPIPGLWRKQVFDLNSVSRSTENSQPCPQVQVLSRIAGHIVRLYRPVMSQCTSKVFFPDDPRQPPQFNDCPRQAETTRRIAHSVMKLCATCASVWDEQDGQIVLPVSRQRNVFRQFDVCFQTGFGVSICET